MRSCGSAHLLLPASPPPRGEKSRPNREAILLRTVQLSSPLSVSRSRTNNDDYPFACASVIVSGLTHAPFSSQAARLSVRAFVFLEALCASGKATLALLCACVLLVRRPGQHFSMPPLCDRPDFNFIALPCPFANAAAAAAAAVESVVVGQRRKTTATVCGGSSQLQLMGYTVAAFTWPGGFARHKLCCCLCSCANFTGQTPLAQSPMCRYFTTQQQQPTTTTTLQLLL